MIHFFMEYPWTLAILALVLSAAVRALPAPADPPKGFWQGLYFWFYGFTHGIMANWDKVSLPSKPNCNEASKTAASGK